MLGEAFAALGNTRAAADAIRRAEALGAASPELGVEVAFQEAYGLYQRGDYARAIPRLVGVYNDDPRGPRAGEALFWAGESAFQAGDYGQADDLFQRFLNEFPDHRQAIAARYVVAWGHFKRRDYSASANAFERFLSAYTRSAESVPYFADALLRLGDSYYALRRFDNAISVYSRVASATSDQRGLDYARFQTGQAHNGAGRTAEAVASYDRLLRDFPNSPLRAQARYAKGFLLFQGGDYDAAITEYRTLIQAQPDSPIAPKALYGIGDAYYNAGRLAEAETAYRQVLTRYPNSPFVANALDGLEYALQGQGRGDEIGPIIAAYEARNSDPSARDGIRLRQAELAFENGDFQGAVDRLTAFVASAQDRSLVASALLTLGSAYGALGQLNDEARTYTRLVNDHTDSPLRGEAVLRLGETYLAMNQPRQAADALANYERRFPGDAERVARALWAEARALRTLGREADADIRLGRLFDAYGDTAAADEARQSFPDGTDGDR